MASARNALREMPSKPMNTLTSAPDAAVPSVTPAITRTSQSTRGRRAYACTASNAASWVTTTRGRVEYSTRKKCFQSVAVKTEPVGSQVGSDSESTIQQGAENPGRSSRESGIAHRTGDRIACDFRHYDFRTSSPRAIRAPTPLSAKAEPFWGQATSGQVESEPRPRSYEQ